VISPTNRRVAALRDRVIHAASVVPSVKRYVLEMRFKPMPRYLQGAVYHAEPRSENSPTGTLFIQPRVDTRDQQNVLLDDVVGPGFAVLCWSNNLRAVLGDSAFDRWKALGTRFIEVRPMTQLTNERFAATGAISAKGDDIAGLEVAAIMKSFHVAAEAQKVWVRGTYTPAEQAAILADLGTNTTPNGTPYNGNPSFWGGYVEAGFYLTGETRSYKGGSFGRVKVLHPFNDGGWGAFQINGRVDYVNLSDRVDGTTLAAPFYVNGGKQVAYQLSGIWNPTDYIRLMAQYSHINVTGGPRNALADDLSDAVNKREFDSDVLSMRAQVDF